ncbi:S8 family peptidase [Spirosoma radiotolerans]|uniref:S8 family peptidase n=1 Tax=Spirosoma radiotolerans TaxID=1379870 RepID=UPI0006270900|nr:S8 family peptidase [Spirosoma radiotolerans]
MSFLIGSGTQITAQSLSGMVGQGWQTELTTRHTSLRERTLQAAKTNSWSLSKNYSNQRILTLQEIDPFGQPVYYTLHNTEAARGTQTQALYGTGSLPIALSGSSASVAGRLGLWDGGRALGSHSEFAGATGTTSRILQKDGTTLNNHTTHLAGTLIAKGVNAPAKGMAYGSQLSVWDYTNDITELVTAAPNLLVSNHSYGPVVGWVYNESRPGANPDLKWEWWGNTAISATEDYLFGFYTANARDLDRIAYNNPFFLMVRSADNKRSETGPPAGTPYFLKNTTTQSVLPRSHNDAYDVIPAEANAKNVLTVGAATVSFTGQNKAVLAGPTAFSGWGPTDDGRIKPDLLGIGTDVLSSLATSDTAYGTYSGTSMAAANVTGSLFLLQELYASQRAPGLPTGGQFMRAATLKGLALHTANRAKPEAGPDYRQGWGLLNTEAAARLLLNENLANLVLEKSLTPGSTFIQSITAQGNEPLIVTLCWTDPEGVATNITASSVNSRTPKLINDLDLRLKTNQQSEFPFVLNPAQPAQAATRGDNIRDNVEQIYIASPIAGQTYTLVVSHKGKMTYSSQPFTVIISGLRRADCKLAASILPAQDTTICSGTRLVLQAANKPTGLRYQWLRNGIAIPNAPADAYQVTETGSYLLRITDSKGCAATSQPVQVQVRTATAAISPSGDQWLCPNKPAVSFQTSTSSNDAIIDWLRDGIVFAHTATILASQSGRYQVRVTKDGCQALSTETDVLLSSVNSLNVSPEETELMLPVGASVTLKASIDSSYRYQWYQNEQALAKANDYRLLVTQPGVYKLQVKQRECVAWSTARTISPASLVTALTTDPSDQVFVYPNPAEHTLSIRYTGSLAKQTTISIVDLRGVLQQPPFFVNAQNGHIKADLSVQALSAGTYVLHLTDGHFTQAVQFIKK